MKHSVSEKFYAFQNLKQLMKQVKEIIQRQKQEIEELRRQLAFYQ